MRLKAVKKLVDINILYAIQTSQLQQYRKRQAKTPDKKINVSLQAIRSYLLLGGLYLFIFGIMGSVNRMVGNPGLFANLVSVFALFSMSQGFLVFYNVFYESRDLQAYRPYAFSEAEIIMGKSISVVLTLLIAILPLLSYFLVLGFQGGNPLLGLPLALLAMAVFSLIITFSILILVHFITKTAVFRKYKNILSNIILALVSLASVVLYFFINQMSNRGVVSQEAVPSFFPPVEAFYNFILDPLNPSSLLGMAGWLVAAGLLFTLVRFKVLPEFYEAALTTGSSAGRQERVSQLKMDEAKHFNKLVWRYHLRLLGEGSVLMQAILMSAVLPYIFIFSLGMGMMRQSLSLAPYLTPRYLLPLIVVAAMIATLNSGGNNLTAIGISLERENFDYLKVLPLDIRQYIRLKFWYLFAIQSILPVIFLLAAGLAFQVHPVTLVLVLLAWFLTSLIWSAWGYQHDYKHLVTTWSNVTEILSRDNNMAKALLVILIMIGVLVATTFLFILASYLPLILTYLLSLALLILLLMGSFLAYRHYMKKLETDLAQFS